MSFPPENPGDVMKEATIHMKMMEPQVPSWAKAEQMEISVPQSELWKYGDAPSRMTARIRKWLKSGDK